MGNAIGRAAGSERIDSPLKWHGGKSYLAARIVAMMPPHIHYVEPFAGGLSVLLAKDPEGVSEVVNDLNGELANFWRVLQSDDLFDAVRRITEATAFCEPSYAEAVKASMSNAHAAQEMCDRSPVDAAWCFFVRCRQSLAGRMESFAPLSRTRTRRGMNEQVSAWLSAVEGLPAVHARLKRVVVLNRAAPDVIRQQDGPETLFYLDPPYLKTTRAAPEVYAHEMTADDHRRLLELVTRPTFRGKVMLSGYRSELYDGHLGDWHRTDFDIANHSAGGGEKRRMVESVWTNFEPVAV